MSHQTTPTTKGTIGSNSKEATSIDEAKTLERTKKRTDFLDKPFLDDLKEVNEFMAYQKRYGQGKKTPCFVSEYIFDLLTGGDIKSPLYQTGDGPIIDVSRKEEGLDILLSRKDTATVIVR